MNGLKDIAKGGWHPKGNDGGRESWRKDFKGVNQVAGWIGKGKDTTSTAYQHQSAPLSSLRDPAEFGPPPKRIQGMTESPTATSSSPSLDSTSYSERPLAQREPKSTVRPLTSKVEEPTTPNVPFRTDTTGLSTAHLPPPPVFRGDGVVNQPKGPEIPKPKLPPRLPPRDSSIKIPASPPPAYDDTVQLVDKPLLNQGAINQLRQASVTVPELGIGRTSPPHLPPRSNTSSSNQVENSSSPQQSQLSELQSRFTQMRTGSSESSTDGTTWAQKRAAVETARNFKKDPSSVSISDLRDSASTANNFRERHGDQISTGWKAASNINQKYGITDRVKSYSSNEETFSDSPNSPGSPAQTAHKKRPPPPPPKKHEWNNKFSDPPPVPLSSKPKPMG